VNQLLCLSHCALHAVFCSVECHATLYTVDFKEQMLQKRGYACNTRAVSAAVKRWVRSCDALLCWY
jgi:hypothetical protein